jgi:hypothetical protein
MTQHAPSDEIPGGPGPEEEEVSYTDRLAGVWSKRRAAFVGAQAGTVFGLIFFVAYGLTSFWICSGVRSCPDHWLPYVAVPAIGWAGMTAGGALAGLVLRQLYRTFKVV